ncbi:hypothetical protein MLD38_026709 [Melastoma candidum]|uniref:Uncharacterized protein n=1 Tax=Melastoma candidum TaxID=119954 RepID=A0ACB9P2C9_9MYRT|nr:hypothetical protein MLD38_026709 [Melastoma candidum]
MLRVFLIQSFRNLAILGWDFSYCWIPWKLLACYHFERLMECGSTPGLFPLHRCKILHLVRHGQGIHNVEGDKIADALLNPQYLDAHLTELGWWQVDNLRKHVQTNGLSKKVDLVITSPLMRTLQTAVRVFGGEGSLHEPDIPPLMMENAGKSGRAAISSQNCPPILAVELCREHLRSSISNYRTLFPGVDFSMVESDEDILWKADIREANEELAERGRQFLNWLWTRREKEIAVVTHSGFLFHMLSSFGNDCHPSIKTEICKHFANCELRSVVIVDRSMHGSDPTTTNYPGKIPAGLDFPSSNVNNHSMGKNSCNSTKIVLKTNRSRDPEVYWSRQILNLKNLYR